MSRIGLPFLATLPVAFIVTAGVGAMLERSLYQHLYKATHLDQVLFSIGLVFMAIAGATYLFGPAQQPVQLPEFLKGQVRVFGLDLGAYRLFLIALVVAITVALTFLIERTRFGAQIRASVDNQQASAGLGINVDRVFGLTFALGSGLAGLAARSASTCLASSPRSRSSTWVLPARRGSRRRGNDQRTARPPPWSSACSTSPANITCRKSARSSSMR
jgi:branched-chain amino acid transport system permease protein